MLRVLTIMAIFTLAACSGYSEPYQEKSISGNYATIEGTPVIAIGNVASFAGAFESNGYIEIKAVDQKEVAGTGATMAGAGNFMSKVLFGAAGGNVAKSEFKQVKIAPGRREVAFVIAHGPASGSRHKFVMTAEPNRRYVIKAEGDGSRGNFWIEDDLGRKTQKQGFRIVTRLH